MISRRLSAYRQAGAAGYKSIIPVLGTEKKGGYSMFTSARLPACRLAYRQAGRQERGADLGDSGLF